MIRKTLTGLVLALAALTSLAACAATGSNNDTLFEKGLHAARHGDWKTLAEVEKKLPENYPLRDYLDFHKLRDGLPKLDPRRIQDYAKRYPESRLPDSIRRSALRAYVKAGRLKDARTLFDSAPGSTSLRCDYLRARLPVDREAVLNETRKIWLHGRSQPSSCDPLFETARADGFITESDVWQRMRLAFRADQPGLMRYLQRMLDGHEKAGDWLLKLYQHPQKVDDLPHDLVDSRRQQLIALALRRLAYTDTVAARKRLQNSRKELGFTDTALRKKAATRVAWYSIIRGIEANRAWQDRWLADSRNQTLLDQRARLAISEQDWQALPHWINRLSSESRQESRWLYWLARAEQENGKSSQARENWRKAAQHRNFYGFLASDRLGQGYQFNNQTPQVEPPASESLGVTRVAILRRLNETAAARSEWSWLLWHSNTQHVRALAELALDKGWYDAAVQASIQAKAWNVLAWRFPPAYQQEFISVGRRNHVDPWLTMAIARRESAFYPQARSGAGALGLMQLLPGTARKVAREAGEQAPGTRELMKPDPNIRLGTRYLAGLLKRFDGNRVLALAAYNGGPSRVKRWLANGASEGVPADVWIASIPFHETRAYVQAVLAYRVLFMGLDKSGQHTTTVLSNQERTARYSEALLRGNR